MRVPAVVLAGGAASRMGGGDKTLLALGGDGGDTILDRILARLDGAHDLVAVSANGDASRFGRFGVAAVLADERPVGPLAGVLSALRWAAGLGAAAVLTVPGDAPFLPVALAAALSPAPAMASSGGRRHPTAALWRTADLPALAAHLSALEPGGRRRDFSVVGFAATLPMRVVEFPAVPSDPFLNVNTPDDLRRARALVGC